MKLQCPCGNKIYDGTDFLSYKASLIADQDYEDFMLALQAGTADAWDVGSAFRAATLYQCTSCRRLLLARGNLPVYSFLPEGTAPNLLHSTREKNWRRPLVGHWADGQGELFWGGNAAVDGDSGFLTEIATWQELEAHYFGVFERLKAADRLRSAYLTRDGQRAHGWSFGA